MVDIGYWVFLPITCNTWSWGICTDDNSLRPALPRLPRTALRWPNGMFCQYCVWSHPPRDGHVAYAPALGAIFHPSSLASGPHTLWRTSGLIAVSPMFVWPERCGTSHIENQTKGISWSQFFSIQINSLSINRFYWNVQPGCPSAGRLRFLFGSPWTAFTSP